MDKKEQRSYDEMVAGIMASLDANYMALKRHPYTRGTRTDDAAASEVADLLNRSVPVTDAEKIVAATFRWIAHKHRGAFIKLMFEGRFACVCQYVDGRLIETGLNSEGTFSVNATSDGFRIGEPRPPRWEDDRDRGGRRPRNRNRNKGGRRRDGGGRRDDDYRSDGGSRDGGRATPEPRGAPVLDEDTRRDLMDQLDRQVAGGAPAAAPPQPGDQGAVSYLAAASGARKASPEPPAAEAKDEAAPAEAAPAEAAPAPAEAAPAPAPAPAVLTMTYPPGTSWADVMDDDDEDFAAPASPRKPAKAEKGAGQ
jgi:hypothetical protein